MELKQDDFFDEMIETQAPVAANGEVAEVTLPFPEKDYDKKGKLKRVRGRMLKKLLKSEAKHYLPVTLCIMGLLLITGIFCGVGLRRTQFTDDPTGNTPFFDIMEITSLLLFIGCCFGALVFATVYPISRYEKNFFQNEGYLTFSIPASMEEQVLAKRIAAAICSYATSIVLILSIFLAILVSGEGLIVFEDLGRMQIFASQNDAYMEGGHAAAYMLESLLSAIISGVMVPSVFAVLTCLFSKISGKKKTGLIILLIFAAAIVFDSISAALLTGAGESIFPQTPAWAHVLVWLSILAEGAVTVGCICFEIWYLKHKLDLK